MSTKKRDFHLNIGTSSILFTFVILCLVSFAVLSLVSAVSDYRLSTNVAENTTAYYQACGEIESQLSQLDEELRLLYESGISRVGYFEKEGKHRSFAYPISDIQTLTVEIDILYPENKGEGYYAVKSWQVLTTGNLEYDDSLNVIK